MSRNSAIPVSGIIAFLVCLVACAPTVPPDPNPTLPPTPTDLPYWGLSVTVTDARTQQPIPGAHVTLDPARGDQGERYTDSSGRAHVHLRQGEYRVRVESDGYQPAEQSIDQLSNRVLQVALEPVAPIRLGRRGPIRISGRTLVDDDGPFLALGASLFWALWGEQNDPDRLDANLRWLSERDVDYVRILAMVGSESWSDRRIDPAGPDYWDVADRLLARLKTHGLRAHVTLFADAQVMMSSRADRERFVDQWAARVNAQPDRFMVAEIANEYWQNGFEDVDDLRALGRRLAQQTNVLVALSTPKPDGTDACALYAGSGADVMTMHYQRDFRADGPWRPARQPWGVPLEYDSACRGQLPPAMNSEPIGPQSSVAADDDPTRLIMGALTTWVAQNSAYVLHTGAGIRGGGAADLARGRSANLWEVAGADATLRGLQAWRAILPPDLPNWSRHNAGWPGAPIAGFDRAIEAGALIRAYAATKGDQSVVVVLGLKRPVTVAPKRAAVIDGRAPLTAAVLNRYELAAAQPFTLEGREAFVLIGEVR